MHFADTRPHEFRLEYSHESPLFGAGVSFDWQPPVDTLRQQAVDAAKQADAVVRVRRYLSAIGRGRDADSHSRIFWR